MHGWHARVQGLVSSRAQERKARFWKILAWNVVGSTLLQTIKRPSSQCMTTLIHSQAVKWNHMQPSPPCRQHCSMLYSCHQILEYSVSQQTNAVHANASIADTPSDDSNAAAPSTFPTHVFKWPFRPFSSVGVSTRGATWVILQV
jgi:hypothetical protein